MKLRLDPGQISYRLELDELERLIAGESLRQEIPLPTGRICYRAICLPDGAAARFETAEKSLTLSLARDALIAHKASLPSLSGIISSFPTEAGGEITVALEVNLKKRRKHQLEK